MIRGIGVDICRCCRFEGKERRFLERIFSPEELSVSTSPEYLASRFAAKEAFAKALGTGIRGFSLTDVTVREDDALRPLREKALCIIICNEKHAASHCPEALMKLRKGIR